MGEADESVRDKLIMRWVIIGTIVAFAILVLTSCASPPQTITIEKPVVVAGSPEYLPIPASFFTGCLQPNTPGPTNGDLLLHDYAEAQYAACLQRKLDAIRTLK